MIDRRLKMKEEIGRREFLQLVAAGGVLYASGSSLLAFGAEPGKSKLISPGCRRTKVKVARLYMGLANPHWPKPSLNLKDELKVYESEFAKLKGELSDVEFAVDELITSPEQVGKLKDALQNVDGILAIHITIGIGAILNEILSVGKPTVVFAIPYSGHEWHNFGSLQRQPLGAKMECLLTSDYKQLAFAIRPFRAIHHLREARILDVTTRDFSKYADNMKNKFGTEIKQITLDQVVSAYNAVSDDDAKAETDRWVKGAEKVVEPSMENIFKACKQALAFEKLLDEEDATVMTVDCYGTMWDKTIKLPAYPCLGFVRLNNMGLGGICESDLQCAMTHIMFQGLSGRPSFISDPTVDESKNSIILAHCLGTTKMDGPDNPAAPYKLRDVMERQEGVVPQVHMRIGQKVTQAILLGTDLLPYFTGEIIEAPVGLEVDRGCRTKITVKVDGDVRKLWKNWTNGLHRQTCYGDITRELGFFCRFKEIKMVNEVV
jgi:hypothetical protein